jgi:hypothetical protein
LAQKAASTSSCQGTASLGLRLYAKPFYKGEPHAISTWGYKSGIVILDATVDGRLRFWDSIHILILSGDCHVKPGFFRFFQFLSLLNLLVFL